MQDEQDNFDIVKSDEQDFNIDDSTDNEDVDVEVVNVDEIVGRKIGVIASVLAATYLLVVFMLPMELTIKGLYLLLLPASIASLSAAALGRLEKPWQTLAGFGGSAGMLLFIGIVLASIIQTQPGEAVETLATNNTTDPQATPQEKATVDQTFELVELKTQCTNSLMTVESKGFTKKDRALYQHLSIGQSTIEDVKKNLGTDFQTIAEKQTSRAYRWDLEGVSLYLTFKHGVLRFLKAKPKYIGCDFILHLAR